MERIEKGEETIYQILGDKEVMPNGFYRVSHYVITGQTEKACYVKEMLGGAMFRLSEKEWSAFRELKEHGMTGSELETNGLSSFVTSHVAILKESDEYQLYAKLRLVLRTLANKEEGLKRYTILPTTACNARCVYCYEEGMQIKSMSQETANAVVDFICRTRRDREISITWFGGEPLIMKDVISYICERLTDQGVPFHSEIVTNAVLMDQNLAMEAQEKWHLKVVQVSVDGLRRDYENRKAFCDPKLHNYDTMMRAIHCILDAGMKVILRCNYDEKNLQGMKAFLDEVRREFGNTEQLSLYFGMLFQTWKSPLSLETYRAMYDLRRYLDETGMHYRSGGKKNSWFRVNYCMADSLGESIVIDPEGRLSHCEHLPENSCFSSVFDQNYRFEMADGADEPQDKCKYCPFLSQCTPFYGNGCEDYTPYCRQLKEIDAEYAFEKMSF